MPKSRFQIYINASTQVQIDQTKALVEAQLPNPSRILDRPTDWIQEPYIGKIQTVLHVRLKTTADLDTLWSKILSIAIPAGVHGITSRHECSHDDPQIYNCKDDPRSAYVERIF